MWNRHEGWEIMKEIAILVPYLPPWFEFTPFGVRYYNFIVPLILTLVICKVLLLIRLQQLWSPLNNQASKLIMAFSKIENNQSLMYFKSWIKLNPFETLVLGFLLYIPFASYIIMVAERSNYYIDFAGFHQTDLCYSEHAKLVDGPSTQTLTYIDSIWMVVVTFLTIGYGDYSPMTYIGRAMSVVTVIYGQIYAAMIIGLVHNKLRPTEIDKVVYEFLANKKRNDKVRRYAAKSILYLLKANLIRKRHLRTKYVRYSWRDHPECKKMMIGVCVNVAKFKTFKL
jgi:hypothetical protein